MTGVLMTNFSEHKAIVRSPDGMLCRLPGNVWVRRWRTTMHFFVGQGQRSLALLVGVFMVMSPIPATSGAPAHAQPFQAQSQSQSQSQTSPGDAARPPGTVAPLKGPLDKREYRYVTLANRLRVLLVSDPTTDTAAAALDIDVGSGDDPDERLGLAHFLEHMLFLGTQKYPEAGEYQRFIQAHGGRNNASTSLEHTNYYFEIEKSQLQGALDRFAQFFIGPLFDEEFVDRERHAVHSEYQARLKSDGSRTWDATKQLFNPAHPASRFSVGSLDTLSNEDRIGLRQSLVTFWNEKYSSNRMTLAIYGAESLATLESWAQAIFSPIQDRDVQSPSVDVPLVLPQRVPSLLKVSPERDIRTLTLSFPIPSPRPHFRAKPLNYLSNLLGHEGPGSLLSLLKAQGWSDGLSAGAGFTSKNAGLFRVGIRLTEAGLKNIDGIVAQVFGAIDAIRAEGILQWRHQEQAQLLDLAFKYREPGSPMRYTVELAGSMHEYPAAQVLRGSYHLSEFAPELIRSFLDQLTPDNLVITLQAQGLKTDRKSPHFNAPYSLGAIPSDWTSTWMQRRPDPRLVLAPPNEFVPQALGLKTPSEPSLTPRVLSSGPGMTLFHHQDTGFNVPKANVFLSVRSPRANDSPEHRVLTELFLRLVTDQLQEFTYSASLAGLDYQLYPHMRGFSIRVSGYDDKIDLLLARITGTLRALKISPARFDIEVDDLQRRLSNERKDRSFRLAMREVSALLLSPRWTEEEKLKALAGVSPQRLQAFVPELLGALNVVLLAHGNVTQGQALEFAKVVSDNVLAEATPIEVPRGSVIRLGDEESYRRVLEVEHQDSGIALYLQGRSRLTLERARFALLRQVVATPFYHELRTRQQLGYVVFAGGMGMLEVPGIAFVVQSPGTDAPGLEQRIREFLSQFSRELATMDEVTFAKHKVGLLSQILEKDKSLRERSSRYWQDIDRGRFRFDSKEKLADAVRSITRANFVDFVQRTLANGAGREISVWARGRSHAEVLLPSLPAGVVEAANPRAFQRMQLAH
jgi:insulysin